MAVETPDPQHHAPPEPLVSRTTAVYHGACNTLETPHDSRNRNYSKWFNSSLTYGSGKPAEITKANHVTALVDGPETFKSMVEAINTAHSTGHFIYLLGWSLCDDLDLGTRDAAGQSQSIHSLFTKASSLHVEIRAMLSGHYTNENSRPVHDINALTTGAAILDSRVVGSYRPSYVGWIAGTHLTGSHHQKILIVNGSKGLIAFCGGVDIYYDRIVAKYDGYCGAGGSGPSGGSGAPLHDVHCRIQGPAANELLRIFVERWEGHPDVSLERYIDFEHNSRPTQQEMNALNGKRSLLGKALLSKPAAPTGGKAYVQIGRTYGNGQGNHGGNVPGGYSYARTGEHTAKDIILHAIAQAENLIYMEDQYMVSMDASIALHNALKSNPKLKVAILIPNTSITEMPHAREHRRAFCDNLKGYYIPGSLNSRVAICTLRPSGATHTYVHAKTYIIDDKLAIIGSANCNRRSWTNDSEVVAAIYDESGNDKRRVHFAHDLRIRLWREHLNKSAQECFDVGSFAHWLQIPIGAKIEPFDRDISEPEYAKEVVPWDAVDPNGL